jgi:hypothetical protein
MNFFVHLAMSFESNSGVTEELGKGTDGIVMKVEPRMLPNVWNYRCILLGHA